MTRLCLALAAVCLPWLATPAQEYLVGRGMADITGPAAEVGMAGYFSLDQKTSGIHLRLRSRAFIVGEMNSDRRVVFVSVDQGMVFQGVALEVCRQLKDIYGGIYNEGNVVLSATHTHAGPGGHTHYALLNLTTLGYIKQNFDVIVEGIVASIVKAHDDLQPGRILINRGHVADAGVNRSMDAYNLNPASERAAYGSAHDTEMTLLRFEQGGNPVGTLNWFAVHPVSMPNSNRHISGDNKGYASYLFEKEMGVAYDSDDDFVAAFAQTNSGDISPNLNLDGTGPGNSARDSCRIIGERQYGAARQLFDQATTILSGGLDYRQSYVDMSNVDIDPIWTGAGPQRTCASALGYAVAAGTEDGRGMEDLFSEGDLVSNPFIDALTGVIASPDQELCECHGNKPILLATGITSPYPWHPEVLSLGILRIGRLAIISMPGEITTMAGRRLRATVAQALAGQVDHVVIASLVNAYTGYVTTNEEYQIQHYEGGHTIFGPWTLAAYQQEYNRLAGAMALGQSVPAGPKPRDLSQEQMTFQTGVVLDNTPIFKSFGDVANNASSRYSRGQTVTVKFWTGHPKNDLKTEATYLKVQRKSGSSWVTVATDGDWETLYTWERVDPVWGTSRAVIQWTIPEDAAKGDYRIKHYGSYKNGWNGRIYDFTGKSRTFRVD